MRAQAATAPAPAGIDLVVVGFSRALLSDLDSRVAPGSVLVVDEPEVIEARGVEQKVDALACVGALRSAPTQDEDAAAHLADLVGRPAGVRAVVPGLEYGVVGAAALSDAWGLRGAGPAARLLRDKSRLRSEVDVAVAQPAWGLVESAEEISRFRDLHGGRCVVKPTNCQASLGVRLLGPRDDTAEAFEHARQSDEPLLRSTNMRRARVLVEEFLEGPEVSHEALADEGRVVFANVTAKDVLAGDRPVELGHIAPAPLPVAVEQAVHTAVERLVAATGFRTGVLHSEWILVDGTTPHLVECAGRLPGDSIDVLIDLAYPGNLLDDYLALLRGRSIAGDRAATGVAAIRFLTAGAGVVRDVEGVEDARNVPGVDEVEVTARSGDHVGALTSSWDRLGHVIACAKSADAAVATLESAVGKIVITVGAAS